MKPQVVANYFHKLSQIFWVSKNYFFHAYAWNKFYTLSKMYNKVMTEEEGRIHATALLLSGLCIPPEESKGESVFEFDMQRERNTRMSSLLSFNPISVTPNRSLFLEEIEGKVEGLQVLPELSDLFMIVEKKFQPTKFCKLMKTKLEIIAAHPALKQYLEPLSKVALFRYVEQISRVYDCIKLSEFATQCALLNIVDGERYLAEMAKKRLVDLHIDYQRGVLNFKAQELDTAQLHHKLSELGRSLQTVVNLISNNNETASSASGETFVPSARQQQSEELKNQFFLSLPQLLAQERTNIKQRRQLIEDRKEQAELADKLKKQKEDELRLKLAQEQALKDKRLAEEAVAMSIIARKEQEEREAVVKQLKAMAPRFLGPNYETSPLYREIEKGGIKSVQEFLQKHMAEHEKEQKESLRKLKRMSKVQDWMERAKRMKENPLLTEKIARMAEEDRSHYQTQVDTLLKQSREFFERNLEEKKRLLRMTAGVASFEEQISARRKAEYDRLAAARQELINTKRTEWEERNRKIREEEDRRRLEEERAQREIEEKERKRKEEIERKRKEEEDNRRKLDELAERQRKREEEIMLKNQKRESDERGSSTNPRAASSSSTSVSSSTSSYVPPHLRSKTSSTSSGSSRDRFDFGREKERDSGFGSSRDRDRDRDRDREYSAGPSYREKERTSYSSSQSAKGLDRDSREKDPRDRRDVPRERDSFNSSRDLPRDREVRDRDPRDAPRERDSFNSSRDREPFSRDSRDNRELNNNSLRDKDSSRDAREKEKEIQEEPAPESPRGEEPEGFTTVLKKKRNK
jgi:translation initiation factor 3 subunit A